MTVIAIDVETKAKTAATDTVAIARLKTRIAVATEMTTVAIAEEDLATAQGKDTDHDPPIPSDEGTQSRNRHLLQSHAVRYPHKTINSVAK